MTEMCDERADELRIVRPWTECDCLGRCLHEPKLSTPEDVDSRTGERRLLKDDYRLHADHVDTVRLALRDQVITFTAHLQQEDRTAPVWVDELWAIERACRALGIDS